MWLSVEQVAGHLGLHARTVRGYIRDGRLRGVRIGKQYRVARADLDAFVGGPVAPRPRLEAATVVEVDGVSAAAADRLSTLLVAGAQAPRDDAWPLRVRTVYDDARARLKVIVVGGVAATADVLLIMDRTAADILGAENG